MERKPAIVRKRYIAAEIFGKALRKKVDLTFAELFAFEPLPERMFKSICIHVFFFHIVFFLITHLVLSPHLSDACLEFAFC